MAMETDRNKRLELVREINPDRYGKIIDMVLAGVCPYCEKPVDMSEINTPESKLEFEVSGMCRACYEEKGKVWRAAFEQLTDEQRTDIMNALVAQGLFEQFVGEVKTKR